MPGLINRNKNHGASGFSPSSKAGGLGKVTRTTPKPQQMRARPQRKGGSYSRSSSRGRSRSSSRPRRRLLEGVNQTALARIIVAAAVLLVIGTGALLIYIAAHSSSREIAMSVIDSADTSSVITSEDAGSKVAVAIGGSIKLQDEILKAARSGDTYNFDNYMSEVRQIMNADISIVDLAGTIGGDDADSTGYPDASYPRELVRAMRNIGVTHAITAGKSALYGGLEAVSRTRDAFAENDITTLGAYTSPNSGNRVYVKRINAINVGIAAYNCLTADMYDSVRAAEKEKGLSDEQLGWCVNQLNMSESREEEGKSYSQASDAIADDVEAMRKAGAQYIIICINWDPIKWEFNGMLPDAMTNLAQRMIDMGVDMTVGYGIDTPQRVTVKPYKAEDGSEKKCYVFYSLGNLFSDVSSGQRQKQQESFVINITLTRNANSQKIDSADVVYHPVYTFHDSRYDTGNTSLKYRVVPAMAYRSAQSDGDPSMAELIKGCSSACGDLKDIIDSYNSNRNGSVTKSAVKLGVLKSETAETQPTDAGGGNDAL